jgi:hypothetical protein
VETRVAADATQYSDRKKNISNAKSANAASASAAKSNRNALSEENSTLSQQTRIRNEL